MSQYSLFDSSIDLHLSIHAVRRLLLHNIIYSNINLPYILITIEIIIIITKRKQTKQHMFIHHHDKHYMMMAHREVI